MKNLFKILVLTLFILSSSLFTIAQTNVSGGIYSNTTWTLNNSPYIVTDTVVVFPGVTLTIEPGVIVRFDNNQLLQIRQATLIAQGTALDSITFTSNSNSPMPGIWQGVKFTSTSNNAVVAKLSYCNIFYAITNGGVGWNNHDTMLVTNSTFKYNSTSGLDIVATINNVDSCIFEYNETGLQVQTVNNSYFHGNNLGVYATFITNCIVDSNRIGMNGNWVSNCTVKNNTKTGVLANYSLTNCIIDSNGTGIDYPSNTSLYILNCEIKYNGTGFTDSLNFTGGAIIQMNDIENNYIGFKIYYPNNNISCNKICNNNFYDVYSYVSGNNNNWSMQDNYWCINDSATIQSFIYDGYENINLALVIFMPFDSLGCYVITGINTPTAISNTEISVYPNPASSILNIQFSSPKNNEEIFITDVFGKEVYHQTIPNNSSNQQINISQLSEGVYFYRLTDNKETVRGKFVKQ